MKKLMFAFCLLLGAVIAVNAQDTTSTSTQSDQYRTQDMAGDDQDKWGDFEDKDVIAASELPSTIRQKLQGTDYSGWMVDKAFRKEKDGQTVYGIKLKKGDEKKKVKFDAQGNLLEEKDKD